MVDLKPIPMARRLVVVRTSTMLTVALSCLLVACAAEPVATSEPTPPPSVSTPGAASPPAPVVGIDDISPLTNYAAAHANEFAGLYVDPPGSRSFVMLFTAHVEEHASALAAIASNVTVRKVRFTERELEDTLNAAIASLGGLAGVQPISGWVDTVNNVVVIEVKTDDPTFEVMTELAHGGRIDVRVYPIPGPWANVESGPGWRLLAVTLAPSDEAHAVRAATDDVALDTLWADLGADGTPPAIDFANEVVVAFMHGIGSSCPELRLDGITIGDGEVMSVVSDPLAPRACTADLVGAVAFIVALERSALPADGFTLWLSSDAKDFTQPLDVTLP